MNEEAWKVLRQRYPWPAEPPQVAYDLHGWWHNENMEWFRKYTGPETSLILELGSWLGLSATRTLESCPSARIICVDHWRGSQEHQDKKRADCVHRLPILYETFLRNMWEHRHRVISMRKTTVEGMAEVAAIGLYPGLICVDAAHDTNSVYNDVGTAIKLFPTAIVMGDDWHKASVRVAVWRVCRREKMRAAHGKHVWLLERL